jgi:quercetin dioxygenase-like cupin family protein
MMEVRDARTPGSLGRGRRIKGGSVRLSSGQSIGRHSNGMSEEFILVLEGEGFLEAGSASSVIRKGEVAFIPSQTSHDMSNKSAMDLVYVYFVGDKGDGGKAGQGETEEKTEEKADEESD